MKTHEIHDLILRNVFRNFSWMRKLCLCHSSEEKKRRSSNDKLDIFQFASNKKTEISAVFFLSVVEEGIIFSFMVTVICPLSLFVNKGTDRSVVLFEQLNNHDETTGK